MTEERREQILKIVLVSLIIGGILVALILSITYTLFPNQAEFIALKLLFLAIILTILGIFGIGILTLAFIVYLTPIS